MSHGCKAYFLFETMINSCKEIISLYLHSNRQITELFLQTSMAGIGNLKEQL